MCKYFCLLTSFGCSVTMQKKCFFCFEFELRLPWCCLTVYQYGAEMLACIILDLFATHFSLGHDLTNDLTNDLINADCWSDYCSTHSPVFAAFRHQFLTNMARNQQKHCCVYIFYSISIAATFVESDRGRLLTDPFSTWWKCPPGCGLHTARSESPALILAEDGIGAFVAQLQSAVRL